MVSSGLLLTAFIAFLPGFIHGQNDIMLFLCQHFTNICENGGNCDTVTGKCVCPVIYQGTTCQTSTASCGSITTCDSALTPSVTEGVCMTKLVGGDVCSCAEGYVEDASTGSPNCNNKRVRSSCGESSVTIYFEPYGPFTGKTFVGDGAGNFDCEVFFGSNNALTLPYDGTVASCPGANKPPDQSTSQKKTFQIMVHYTYPVVQSIDRIITYECGVTEDGSLVAATALVAQASSKIGTEYVVKAGGNLAVGVSLRLAATQAPVDVSVPLNVGTMLLLRYDMDKAGSTFASFRVKTLTATDGTTVIDLIVDGCVTKYSEGLVRGFIQSDARTNAFVDVVRTDVTISAFKFPNTGDVTFHTTMKFCLLDSTCDTYFSCDAAAGDSIMYGALGRRRRRDANNDDEESLSLTFKIKNNFHFDDRHRAFDTWKGVAAESTGHQSCVSKVYFLLPMILLSILLVSALTVSIFLYILLKDQEKEDALLTTRRRSGSVGSAAASHVTLHSVHPSLGGLSTPGSVGRLSSVSAALARTRSVASHGRMSIATAYA